MSALCRRFPMLLPAAFVAAWAIALAAPGEAPAQATMAITTPEGQCLGVDRDGRSVATRGCRGRFNVALDGNRIVAYLADGSQGCLDGYQGKGNTAEVVGCDGTTEQNWYLHGTGQIQNVATNLCLDVQGGRRGSGTAVISWDCDGGASNQVFRFEAADPIGGFASSIDPSATATPAASAGVVGTGRGDGGGNMVAGGGGNMVAGGGGNIVANDGAGLIGQDGATIVAAGGGNLMSENGAGIVANDGAGIVAAGGGNATYSVQDVTPSGYALVTALSPNRCIDVPNGSRQPGTQLVLWDCHGGENQFFSFEPSGEIKIFGLCVDAFGGGGNNGDAVGTYTCNGGANQRWTVTQAGEIRGINDRCLAVSYADGSAGSGIILWDCVGHESQTWYTP